MAHHAKGASPEQLDAIMTLVGVAATQAGRLNGVARLFRAAFLPDDGGNSDDTSLFEAAEILAERLEDIANRLGTLEFDAHVAAGFTKPRGAGRAARQPTLGENS